MKGRDKLSKEHIALFRRRGFNVSSYAFYMPISITELQLDEVNTISIPTDAILIVSLLIVFAILGYVLNNILDNQTNKLVQATDDGSNLKVVKEKLNDDSNLELVKEKLEDQFSLESTTLDQKNLKNPIIKKLNFLPPSKLLGLGSLAIVAIGGVSLLGLQTIQKSYKSMNTGQVKIMSKNESAQSVFSKIEIQASAQFHAKPKKINFVDPYLVTINSSISNKFDLVKERQIDKNFFF